MLLSTLHISNPLKMFLCILLAGCYACTPIERIPSRSMTVTIGPDKVFEHPVESVMPQLRNAVATNINGRVGNELVFWEYRFVDNSRANLFACALLDDVNCEARLAAICPGGGQELIRKVESGVVRQLECRAVGIGGVGDPRPNCTDDTIQNELLIGLMQCQ
jgi:hypothetical protein